MRCDRLASVLLTLALAALVAPAARGAEAEPVFPVVDLHVDLSWQLHFKKRALDLSLGHVTRRSVAAGNVTALVLPLFIPDTVRKGGPAEEDLDASIATLDEAMALPGAPLAPPLTLDAGLNGRVRTFLALEGAQALAASPQRMEKYARRGLRLAGLVHMHDNELGSSSTGTAPGGLTERGRKVAEAALANGVLLDVSHLSDAAFDDVATMARRADVPFLASHSNARAICDHPRNLTDDQLRQVAASGGVVGLNVHGPYVTRDASPSVAHLMKQLDHLVRVAGEDHVAIGSDFDGGITPVAGMPDASAFPAFARALSRRGYSDARIRKIFGGNAQRLLGFTTPSATR